MSLEALTPRVDFPVGVTIEIKKIVGGQPGQVAVVLSGTALEPVLQAANMTELVFNSDISDLNKLSSIARQAATLVMVTA